MCSEGVSVWFACKLCKSFFLNADDFAYHKKKSHVQEFLNTKFIVFEEKTSPTAIPPENWVSFMSPKEETLIHKIISSPLSPTLTNVDCDDTVTGTGNIQRNRNEDFIQIDPEINEDVNYIDDANQYADEEKDQVSNSSFKLNFDSNSNNNDTDKPLIAVVKDPLQINTAIDTGTDCNLTNPSSTEHFSPIIKSTLNRSTSRSGISRLKIENPFTVSSNILQSAIQSPPNPYVHLKRLNMKTIQNASPHSNSTAYTQENENFDNTDFKPDFDLDPFSNTVNNYNDDIDVDVSETKFSNVTHDSLTNISVFHDPFSTSERFLPEEDDKTSQTTSVAATNLFRKNQDSNEINPHPDFVPNSKIIPDPTIEVAKFNFGPILEVVKTELEADGNENKDSEFSDEDHETESQMELLTEEDALNVTDSASNSLNEIQASQASYFCLSCKTPFSSIKNFREHNKDYHTTQDGKLLFKCPYPNCGKTFPRRGNLERHFREVHSNAKPWKCPYLNCKQSFKTLSSRNDHLKTHTANDSRGKFECPYPNCGKTSNLQCNLKSHIKQVHSDARPFKCPHRNCNKSFKIRSIWKSHLKCHTKNALKSSRIRK